MDLSCKAKTLTGLIGDDDDGWDASLAPELGDELLQADDFFIRVAIVDGVNEQKGVRRANCQVPHC